MNTARKKHHPTKEVSLAYRIRQLERRISQTPLPVRIDKKVLRLGTNLRTNSEVQLIQDYLQENNVHIIGATRTGKTRLMRYAATELAQDPNATIIELNAKGALGRHTRDDLIKMGMADRLIFLDPNDYKRGLSIGYNFLRENGLPVSTHAKAVREAIRSGFGQANFDATAQLARGLYLALYTSRACGLTLREALQILYPNSPVRQALLPKIEDPVVKEALAYLDSLNDPRQDQLLASSIARLEAFVSDPIIRRIITQQRHSLDISEVIENKRILIVNMEQNRPLRADDIKLLGRLIINDIVGKVFEREPNQAHHPVYLLIDELYWFVTEDLCRILDQGHELGLHALVAHQYMSQLDLGDNNRILRDSILNDASIKMVFRLNSVEDAKFFSRELFFDQFNPWMVKDEIFGLELEPVEETRTSRTKSRSGSRGRSLALHHSVAEGESESETYSESSGESFGEHEEWGKSKTKGHADTVAAGVAHTDVDGVAHTTMDSDSSMVGHGQNHGGVDATGTASMDATSTGVVMNGDLSSPLMATPQVLTTSQQQTDSASASNVHADSFNESDFVAEGVSHAEADAVSHAEANSLSLARAKTTSESEGETESGGVNLTQSEETTEGTTTGRNWIETHGVTPSVSEEEGWSESETVQPYTNHIKRRVPTSREFLSEEEFVILHAQAIRRLPKGHYVLKLPERQAIFMRAPFVPDPQLADEEREAALRHIYGKPVYAQVEEIEAEERERAKQIAEIASSTPERQLEEKRKRGPTTFRHKIKAKNT